MFTINFKKRPRLIGVRASLGTVAVALLITGCGGGGGGTGAGGGVAPVKLTENNQMVDIGVSGAQAASVATAVPLAILQATAPVGDNPKVRQTQKPSQVVNPFGLTYVASLNLYSGTVVSGKTLTTTFYSDSAGTAPAGTVTTTGTQNINGNYTFPVAMNSTVSITGGNIPVTGQFKILFTDLYGANVMTGNLSLPNNHLAVQFNLTLDDEHSVARSNTLTLTDSQYGMTASLTNLTGGPLTKIVGDMVINPGGYAGTGTLDLINGTFAMSVKDKLAQLILASQLGPNMTLTFPGGGTQVISNVNTFITSTLKNSDTGYNTPVDILSGSGGVIITQVLADGEMVGYTFDTAGHSSAMYWATPVSTPEPMNLMTGYDSAVANGISNNGSSTLIVGCVQNAATRLPQPCYWSKPSGPGGFTDPHLLSLSSQGSMASATSINGNQSIIAGYILTAAQVQIPAVWLSGTCYKLPTDGRSGDLRCMGVDNAGDVLGTGTYSPTNPVIWKGVSSSNVAVTPLPLVGLPNESGVVAQRMSDTGVVVGGSAQGGLYWSSTGGFAPVALPVPSGSGASVMAYGVSADGTKAVGQIQPSAQSLNVDLAYWSDFKKDAVDVTTLLPNTNGFGTIAGFFILSDGSIVGLGQSTTSSTPTWIYIRHS